MACDRDDGAPSAMSASSEGSGSTGGQASQASHARRRRCCCCRSTGLRLGRAWRTARSSSGGVGPRLGCHGSGCATQRASRPTATRRRHRGATPESAASRAAASSCARCPAAARSHRRGDGRQSAAAGHRTGTAPAARVPVAPAHQLVMAQRRMRRRHCSHSPGPLRRRSQQRTQLPQGRYSPPPCSRCRWHWHCRCHWRRRLTRAASRCACPCSCVPGLPCDMCS